MAWEDKDERCEYCNNITKEAKGFNKQNLKRLCFSKPTAIDMAILFMLICVLFAGYRYYVELEYMASIQNNLEDICANLSMMREQVAQHNEDYLESIQFDTEEMNDLINQTTT